MKTYGLTRNPTQKTPACVLFQANARTFAKYHNDMQTSINNYLLIYENKMKRKHKQCTAVTSC